MATYQKPSTRYATSDWFTSNYALSTNAERQRSATHDIRQESRFLRNETNNKTKWDQLDSNTRLSDRVDNIRQWRDILERTLSKVDREISDLADSKDNLEVALENMNQPTHVNIENLVTRESRRDIDVVQDAVEDQLKKEKTVIEGIKVQLQNNISECFEHICILQEARQQLLADLQDKHVAVDIDVKQYNLTEDDGCLSYKPNPTRVLKDITTPQQWEDFSRYNHDRACSEMTSSQQLRETVFSTIQQTLNDLKCQDNATEYALRKRIHEMKMALDELNWQKRLTEDEIALVQEEIRHVVEEIQSKKKPTKLAETRLEKRTYRMGVDLCRDNAMYGLTDEVTQLYISKASLEEKLRQNQHALDNLEKKLHTINEDINCKTNSLKLDEACSQNREKLRPKSERYNNIEKNASLMGLSREANQIIA